MAVLSTTLPARFWNKVDQTSECWTWVAYCTPRGYGRYNLDGRICFAHRVAYEDQRGPIPDGLELDHLCRNTSCVNPDHLEPVTRRENILRGLGPIVLNQNRMRYAASKRARTHCKRGHEYTPENTRYLTSGRECRACKHVNYLQRRDAGKAS